MKILSDEDMIWPELISRLNALASDYDCTFVPFPLSDRGSGIPDEEVPAICRREGAAALLTTNYKEFARHLVYYQALLNAGVSAIVLRQPNPGTELPDVEYQVSLIEPHLRRILRRLEQTDEPLLFVVNRSGPRTRRLRDLIDRFSA